MVTKQVASQTIGLNPSWSPLNILNHSHVPSYAILKHKIKDFN